MDVIAPGHSACAGCGSMIALRTLVEAAGKNSIVCLATGCMEITTTAYPTTAWEIPLIHVAFENAAAVASGVSRALKRQGKQVNVLAVGGDGGMADIGLQAISGALERNENILIVCYDNEAYANTGIQRSSMTPMFASTTTSPAGKVTKGKDVWKKNLAKICEAHDIPYVATASIAYLSDLESKVKKALSIVGPKFIHVHCPCPIGWKFDTSKTVEIAKLAVETGMWVLYEIENGKIKINVKPEKLKPAKEYFSSQGRFEHLNDEQISQLQDMVTAKYNDLISRSG